MLYTTLKDHPEKLAETLKLIETSFEYTHPHRFDVDFYPLINKDNFQNCHIILESNSVVAHIGVLESQLEINEEFFTMTMIGGIAVAESHRGRGLFKKLFEHALSFYTCSMMYILWSEKLDMYKKFGFHPAITLNEYPQKKTSSQQIIPTLLRDLSLKEKEKIKSLYQISSELRLKRSQKQWEKIEHTTSSELFLVKESSEIINYFFKGKGQDLTNTIHEYGYIDTEQLCLMREYANVWSPFKSSDAKGLYAALLRVNNNESFKQFCTAYAQITIELIQGDNISFSFQDSNYTLETSEFLSGVFGPSRFEEISAKDFFISGLDSI